MRNLNSTSQRGYSKKLKFLEKRVNLDNPTETENYILSLNNATKYKSTLLFAYLHYCQTNKISWTPPSFKTKAKPIIVPTEERIDKIISRCSLKYFTIFGLSKHGLRPDEISKITLRDVDLQRGLLTVKTSKLGAERTLKLKENVNDSLRNYIQRRGITNLEIPLFPKPDRLRDQWNNYRKRAYLNFKDQELLKIRLYDLRHWFATTQYLKGIDVFDLQYQMGHRNLETTQIYVHIARGLVNFSSDYNCRTAKTVEEASKLIESGFEYVTEMDGIKLFRKRK